MLQLIHIYKSFSTLNNLLCSASFLFSGTSLKRARMYVHSIWLSESYISGQTLTWNIAHHRLLTLYRSFFLGGAKNSNLSFLSTRLIYFIYPYIISKSYTLHVYINGNHLVIHYKVCGIAFAAGLVPLRWPIILGTLRCTKQTSYSKNIRLRKQFLWSDMAMGVVGWKGQLKFNCDKELLSGPFQIPLRISYVSRDHSGRFLSLWI